MKKCEDLRESLGPWLDGELRGSEADAVRSHVEICPGCGEERRQLELLSLWLKRDLNAIAGRVAFEPFWCRIRQRITEKRAWHNELRGWTRAAFAASRLAWAVPAVIGVWLLVLSIDSLLPGWRSTTPRNNFAAVDSIDAYGRNVALLREDETKTTVIWVYQNQEGDDDSSAENTETRPSF